jgi:hypothetical protein
MPGVEQRLNGKISNTSQSPNRVIGHIHRAFLTSRAIENARAARLKCSVFLDPDYNRKTADCGRSTKNFSFGVEIKRTSLTPPPKFSLFCWNFQRSR